MRKLLIILAVALLLRLPAVTHLAYGDEFRFVPGTMPTNKAGLIENFEMPPLPTWINQLFAVFVPNATLASRLASLLFGMINIVLVYLIGKRLYGEREGLWAAALFGFSAYAVWASTAIELNGVNMLFSFLLAMYAMVSLDKTKNDSWVYLFGIAGGIGMLSRYESFLFYPLFLFDQWYYHNDWRIALRRCLQAGIITLLIFSVFPLLSFFTHSNHFYSTIERGANMTLTLLSEFHWLPYLVQLLYALVWLALPFGALLLLGLGNFQKEHVRWYVWAIFIVAFYTLVVHDNFSPFDRYFTLLMPSFLFVGLPLVAQKRSRQWWLLFWSLLVVMALLLLSVNETQEQLPLYPKEAFVARALSLHWNFLIPFNGGSGPIGFLMSFSSIALAFLVSLLAILAYYVLPKKEVSLALLLATCFAFNAFAIQEHALGLTHPNISLVTKNSIAYIKNTTDVDEPVYFFRNWALKLYLQEYPLTNLDFFNDTATNAEYLEDEFSKGGTIMWIDFPPIQKDGPLWHAVQTCEKETSFYSNGVETAMIFRCSHSP